MKIQKKIWGGGGGGGVWVWGVRMDVNKELNFLGRFTKKKFRGGGSGGDGRESGGGVGLVGGQGGCERNVGGRG